MSWRRPHVQVSADIRAEEVGDTSALLSQTGIELGIGLVFWLGRFQALLTEWASLSPFILLLHCGPLKFCVKGDSRTEYLFPATSQGLRR